MLSYRNPSENVKRKRCNCVRIMHASAAVVIYAQSLFWLGFSLETTPSNCDNITVPCTKYPQEFCGIECPTFAIFLVLVFTNMIASLPGLVLNLHEDNCERTDYSYESKMTLRCYSVAGIVSVLIEIHYFRAAFSLISGAVYVYAITVTRGFWWKPSDSSSVNTH